MTSLTPSYLAHVSLGLQLTQRQFFIFITPQFLFPGLGAAVS